MSFTRWRSLVDGAEIDVSVDIPDSGILQRQDSTLVEPYSDNLEPHPEADNPVMDGSEATDIDADFAADPYFFIENGDWYAFVEYALSNGEQVISYLTSQDRGVTWDYQQVVLDTEDKISFPYIFDHGDDYFMLVNDNAGKIELFKATTFPTDWESAALIRSSSGEDWDDPVIFAYDDLYWSVAAREPGDGNRYIDVFYSDTLESDDWTAHADNPVITNRDEAYRPAGRPYVFDDGQIILFYMDGTNTYSEAVRAYEVTDISTSTWSETQVSDGRMVEGTGSGWNSDKMHHWDPWWQADEGRWVVATDGNDGDNWSVGVYHIPTITNNSVSQI